MYKVAIIGLGRVGNTFDDDPLAKGTYSHAGAYMANPETKIIAACDIDYKKLESFKKKCKTCRLYSDYTEMLKSEQIDIVSICTGGNIHYDIIKDVTKYDIKAIYCEKPMTNTIEKAEEIVAICREKKIVLAVNHLRRWDIGFQLVKKYIENKKIGDIQKFSVYYTKGIINSGTHIFDLLTYFFGNLEYVKSDYSYEQTDLPDPTLDVYIKFKNGIQGVMLGLNDDFFSFFEMSIFGTSGAIYIRDYGYSFEYYEVKKSDKFSGYKDLVKVESPFISGLDDAMPNALNDIIDCIKIGKKPLISGEDAKYGLSVIISAIKSAKNYGEKTLISN